MGKRKNKGSNKALSAAKKMAGQQNHLLSSQQQVFVYHQSHIDVKPLYLATKLADVHFAFDSDDGNITRIPAHKNLLAVTSDVFEKMFCGDLKETGDVKIVDASAAAFTQFLQFFYLSKVKLSAQHLASVLYLGNKYNVEKCIDACVQFLTDNLSNENVCTALSLAILHEQEELTKLCEKQIMLNTVEVFQSADFLDCDKEALAHILKMNLLSCSEVEVFEACMDWVQAKSGQPELSRALVEEHLGNLFFEIRFASMTTKEFLSLETEYSAVLSSDFKAIVRMIEGTEIDPEQFNTSPRQVKWNEDDDAIILCDRDDPSTNKYYTFNAEEKIIFSTNAPLVLGKFQCTRTFLGDESSRRTLKTDVSVKVKITEACKLRDANNAKVVCCMEANFSSNLTTVPLPHPILIRPGLFYTICSNGFPEGHCFQSLEKKSSVDLKSNIKIEFHNDKKTADGKIFGLIHALFFNEI